MPYPRENLLRKSGISAANTALTVDLGSPGQNMRWRLVTVNYAFGPGGASLATNAMLSVTDGLQGEPFQVPVTALGPSEIALGYQTMSETDVKVVLSAGGASVVGYLNVFYTVD